MTLATSNGRKWALVGAATFVLIVGGVAVFALRADAPPSPTVTSSGAAAETDLAALADFVRTSEFNDLPEAQKRPYMRTLRKNSDQLVELYKAGKISLRDYHEAYLNGYLERKLDQMEEYYKLPADRRMKFLTEKYAKKNKEAAKESAKEAAAAKPAAAAASATAKPAAGATPATPAAPATPADSSTAGPILINGEPPEPDEEFEDDFMDDRVKTWPPEEQAKWEEFRKAVKQAKEAAKAKS